MRSNIATRFWLRNAFEGMDLRLVVINFRVVAAAIRKPPVIAGNGRSTVRDLIKVQSRRREAATDGESSIPLDQETERTVCAQGYDLDSILEDGEELVVRKTANLHTGGTIHDVTDIVHPDLVDAAIKAARAIDIPVTGIDFMVKSASGSEYAFVEANERPGLANHEPQPTAERFIDLLFSTQHACFCQTSKPKAVSGKRKAKRGNMKKLEIDTEYLEQVLAGLLENSKPNRLHG